MDQITPKEAVLKIFGLACGPNRLRPNEADLPVTMDTGRVVNRMEAFWTKCLHSAFQSVYPSLTVLSKSCVDRHWDRSEFLHDIAVIECRQVNSPYRKKPLRVAARIVWQVESELDGNGRAVAIDFSKLIAGSAENKLFIVRQPMAWQTSGKTEVLRFVGEMAAALTGNLFLAFVPAYASDHKHLQSYWTRNGPLPLDVVHFSEQRFRFLYKGWP